MAKVMVDPRYKVYAYQDRQFATQEELDKIQVLILMPETAWWKKIIHLVQILAAVAVMWIRDRNMSKAMELAKQGYMIDRAKLSQEDLDRDPLDVVPRPKP